MKTRLYIISASFNAGNCIERLIQSLESQTDKDFVWILVDGGSNDNTLQKAEKIQGIAKKLILNRNDFGIYHAINTGLELCNEGYYVVAGCDDVFYADAVANFKKAILEDNADIIAANVKILQRLKKPKGSHLVWLYGGSSLIAAHSVGTAIRCSLHKKLGNYSNMYPIYADGEFMIRALVSGAKFSYPDFIAGEFSDGGISNKSQLISFSDQFKALVAHGYNFYLQWFLFNLRLLKWYRKISHLQALAKTNQRNGS
ncbi:glycosyltransferase [Cylindrospermopsis raciborskii Cr2010]|uniref:glycosyltransferase n=1 Tax=Cylindrospermopsis raciborskii TaxID=77022 RepID=UPI000E1E70F4|nr:glycosyltransferase [Cylindrospermopsis raciborskii]UJL34099.1 glycosyltransferase [Cylindrospermopsis raciborskii Cr2010]